MEVIDDFAAVRLLINVYMIKKFKRSYKQLNQEIFIEDVLNEFRENNFMYTTKSILYTWKYLLDNYQYYKQNFADGDAKREWKYFELMNNCFETPKNSSEKFKDPRWTFSLLNSLGKYKSTILNQGLTMKILQAVEDDFQAMENYDITQKDIYSQWLSLKKFYRHSQKFGCTKFNNKYVFYEAVKNFFENGTSQEYVINRTVNTLNDNISQNELITAIESITPTERATEVQIDVSNCNRIDAKLICPSETSNVVSNEKFSNALPPRYTPFTIVMHDILLQCFKNCKSKIRPLNGEVDDASLDEAFKEFQRLGYNVTKQSIRNEWNDLTYRYELIKNTEYPQNWPYFNDIDHIYSSEVIECRNADTSQGSPVIVCEKGSNVNNISDFVSDNVGQITLQTQKIAGKDAKMTESLLNVYEANSKEFVEIKDILIERNLLREETNYLLNAFVEKFSKTKR